MPRTSRWIAILAVAVMTCAPIAHADAFDDLARDFWTWRATEMPVSLDDIPRLERPAGWIPDWSPTAVRSYRQQVAAFERRLNAIDPSHWPVPRQVDYRLIGSAIARARWEFDYLGAWKKNPNFYLDQTLGAYFHLLLVPPPFDDARGKNIVATLNQFPKILTDARTNLTAPVRPFADLALDQLKDVRPRLLASVQALKPLLDAEPQKQIDAATNSALHALEDYRQWLTGQLDSMSTQSAIGAEGYEYFLKNVALLPYTPQQLLEIRPPGVGALRFFSNLRRAQSPRRSRPAHAHYHRRRDCPREARRRIHPEISSRKAHPHRPRMDAALHVASHARLHEAPRRLLGVR